MASLLRVRLASDDGTSSRPGTSEGAIGIYSRPRMGKLIIFNSF